MAKKNKAASSSKKAPAVTVRSRLDGTKPFTLGPYKTAHVAHSYASQVRRTIREAGLSGWVVKVDAEDSTVRVSREKQTQATASE